MYISFLLLWLYFQRIHGEITRCPIGGLYDEDLCKQLTDENKHDVYDKPYIGFTENENSPTMKTNSADEESLPSTMKTNSADKESLPSDDETQNNIIIFGQSLFVNELYDLSQIETHWKKTLIAGTDIYRLKFHNTLVRLLEKSDITKLSNNQCMVVIKSYYNAASTYYFSRNYNIADIVIKEGLTFLESVEKKLYFYESVMIIAKVWKALYLLLEKDIKYSLNIMNNDRTESVKELSNDLKTVLYQGIHPSPAALLYRRYFLDNEIAENTTVKIELERFAMSLQLNLKFNGRMEDENIYMYYLLMCSCFGKNEEKVTKLIQAIRRPVLCFEDRLLNYEANKLALKMFKDCINKETDWTFSYIGPCKDLHDIKFKIRDLKTKIINKLSNELYLKNRKENIIEDLYTSISTKDVEINQRTLHVIVTSAINVIKIKSEEYETINQNIKLAIKFLNNFVKGQLKKLNENKKNKTDDGQQKGNPLPDNKIIEPYSESISFKSQPDMDDENELKVINNYNADIYMTAVMETEYSNDNIRKKNIFTALKWLAELNGVLCNDLEVHISNYQTALKSFINDASNFASNYHDDIYISKSDEHLKYLRLKLNAKILFPSSRWEVSSWLGGWIFNHTDALKLEILASLKKKSSNIYFDLLVLKNTSNCPYINKIEINILLYRYEKQTSPDDYHIMYQYLTNAKNEVVITSEDRVRNMEANELLGEYLMKLNRNAVERIVEAFCILYREMLKSVEMMLNIIQYTQKYIHSIRSKTIN